MLPPTRTGWVGGGGGGGGASGNPPTTPPTTPPGTPPSTPPGTPSPTLGTDTSGLISRGASTGAALGFETGTTFGWAAAGTGGGGGGGGGGGAAATNAIIDGGVGSTSVAISGMMMIAAKMATCAKIESGTVYHFCDPTLIDGSTTSPNMSRGTAHPPIPSECGARPRIICRGKNGCQRSSCGLRHRFFTIGSRPRADTHAVKRPIYERGRSQQECRRQHVAHRRAVVLRQLHTQFHRQQAEQRRELDDGVHRHR